MTVPVLGIRDLNLEFRSYAGTMKVLHGISLHINRGERVALVGESGSGKSVTARIVLGLIQNLKSARVSGTVAFNGVDLEKRPPAERHALRGTKLSMIFQDPTSSLNPVFPIATQFREVLRRQSSHISSSAARLRALAALEDVSISEPERVLASYPFQLSGGMNQRVMIAMALANDPELLIADEPGTALDVTVQAQTLRLMRDMVARTGASVLFISHNLGVVREFADRVYVIYKGRMVEQAPTPDLFANPRHPYTQALLSAVPRLTGSGLQEIDDEAEGFFDPLVVHPGAAEPPSAP